MFIYREIVGGGTPPDDQYLCISYYVSICYTLFVHFVRWYMFSLGYVLKLMFRILAKGGIQNISQRIGELFELSFGAPLSTTKPGPSGTMRKYYLLILNIRNLNIIIFYIYRKIRPVESGRMVHSSIVNFFVKLYFPVESGRMDYF